MKKGKDFEAEYFIREDADKKHRMHEEQRRNHKKRYDEELKALHFQKCPKCGHDMESKRLTYIDIDQCTSCGAITLSPDDIDKFIAEERSILKAFIDFFKSE